MHAPVSLNFSLKQKWKTSKKKLGLLPNCSELLLKEMNLLFFSSLRLWETPEVSSFRAEDPALLVLPLLEWLNCKNHEVQGLKAPGPCPAATTPGVHKGEMTLFQ